jgi:metal-responsive CopG/Arc/MetJ family transcriptional regulator
MAGNPKDSEWYSTPKDKRKRKGIEVTLPDEVRERLDALSDQHNVSRSQMVERLIMAAPLRANIRRSPR